MRLSTNSSRANFTESAVLVFGLALADFVQFSVHGGGAGAGGPLTSPATIGVHRASISSETVKILRIGVTPN